MSGSVLLRSSRRFVVKVGSSLLVDSSSLRVNESFLSGCVADIKACRERGQQVVVVSSGAVSLGCRVLGRKRQALRRLSDEQAAAALGQGILLSAWRHAFLRHQLEVAQILVSMDDTESRVRALNARATFESLFRFGVVALVNENDTVATDEIRFGDNDRLAARIAQLVEADTLVLLSDVDGLYTSSPLKNKRAKHIPFVRVITPDIEAMAGLSDSDGRGGMVTKLEAARLGMQVGCRVVISSGHESSPLLRLDDSGYRCSWFIPPDIDDRRPRAYKRWLLGGLRVRGSLAIDKGALRALTQGRSLLPAGVIRVTGHFERGDLVSVKDDKDVIHARGLSSYGSKELLRIMGKQSNDIATILGYAGDDEVIHRDHMVVEAVSK